MSRYGRGYGGRRLGYYDDGYDNGMCPHMGFDSGYIGLRAQWRVHFQWMSLPVYLIWWQWQRTIMTQSLDVMQRRSLLVQMLNQQGGGALGGVGMNASSAAEKMIGMESNLQADQYGHVLDEETRTMTTTTTQNQGGSGVDFMQEKRRVVANHFVTAAEERRTPMEQTTTVVRNICAGNSDDVVHATWDKIARGQMPMAAEPQPLAVPQPQQQIQYPQQQQQVAGGGGYQQATTSFQQNLGTPPPPPAYSPGGYQQSTQSYQQSGATPAQQSQSYQQPSQQGNAAAGGYQQTVSNPAPQMMSQQYGSSYQQQATPPAQQMQTYQQPAQQNHGTVASYQQQASSPGQTSQGSYAAQRSNGQQYGSQSSTQQTTTTTTTTTSTSSNAQQVGAAQSSGGNTGYQQQSYGQAPMQQIQGQMGQLQLTQGPYNPAPAANFNQQGQTPPAQLTYAGQQQQGQYSQGYQYATAQPQNGSPQGYQSAAAQPQSIAPKTKKKKTSSSLKVGDSAAKFKKK